MIYRHILFLLILISDAYAVFSYIVTDRQQKKPIPDEVKYIYTPEKYKEFLSYEHDFRPLFIAKRIVNILLSAFIVYSPFFAWLEKVFGSNEYFLALAAALLVSFATLLFSLPRSYYGTFVIREKYGLNKKTKKEFWKDIFISELTSVLISSVLIIMAVFILKRIPGWTQSFGTSGMKIILLLFCILVVCFAAIYGLSVIAYLIQRKQYKFTELEDGELRNSILDLTGGSKKKIRRIEVYNESSKSTQKNAYMLKILWYRAFGIADNFINENSQRELLAVLAHEAGHLKHKNDILDFSKFISLLILFLCFAWMMMNPQVPAGFVKGINDAFGLTVNQYYLIIEYFTSILGPLAGFAGVLSNYVSRRNEYEADFNAVKEGYGKELIDSFAKMGSDELIDVNPAPLIEFLEDDHPSIVNRIRRIREEMEKIPQEETVTE